MTAMRRCLDIGKGHEVCRVFTPFSEWKGQLKVGQEVLVNEIQAGILTPAQITALNDGEHRYGEPDVYTAWRPWISIKLQNGRKMIALVDTLEIPDKPTGIFK